MKRMLWQLFLIMAVGVFLPIVGYCGVVDDLCSEFGYKYRWTVETQLDDSYKNTVVYNDISDNGRLQISFIALNDRALMKGTASDRYIDKCFVLSGKTEFACAFSKGTYGYISYSSAYIKDDNCWRIVGAENDAHPLHYLFDEYRDDLYNSDLTVDFLRYREDYTQTCVIIGDYRGGKTPIYLGDKFLRTIEDTEMLYHNRRVAYFPWQLKKLPVIGECLDVKAVIREDRKTPAVPDEVNISEKKNTDSYKYEFTYDSKKIESSEINEKALLVSKILGQYGYFRMLEGRYDDNYYYTSKIVGDACFDVEIPIDMLTNTLAKIGPDGKFKIGIEIYNSAVFKIGSPLEGISKAEQLGVVTFTGSKGKAYGHANVDSEYIETTSDGGRVLALLTLSEYDGNILYIKKTKTFGKYDFPKLYIGFDEDGAITGIGFGNMVKVIDWEPDEYECAVTSINEVKIDEAAELVFTKMHFNGSEYLAKPVVESSRAERGAVDYNPDIMFIPVPAEPQGEPVLTPDMPMFSEIGEDMYETHSEPVIEDNAKPDTVIDQTPVPEPELDPNKVNVLINGEKIDIDVEPMTVNNRVLVPARAVFEKLGANVDWSNVEEKVTVSGLNTQIEFRINNTGAIVNGQITEMNVAAQIADGRTLVPIRFLSETLGYRVEWNPAKKLVMIDG